MYRKIIKVFLGSPGDLEEERKAAKVIVDEENANHANELGYHIDLVGWEDTVSQRRRAQDAINVDLDQCEYFVGLMWKKWGTPPGPEDHPYSSGFEEEYRRSVDRHEKTDKPEISLLFKNIAEDDLIDVGKQLDKVLRFQDEINIEKKQYYQKFQDLRDFEQRFRAIIAKFLRDQQLEDRNSEASDPQKPKPEEEKSKDREIGEKQSQIFETDALGFLEEFVGKEQDGAKAFSAADAARFRLLACTVSQSGNDNIELGTHDANLIYRDLRDEPLSERERRGLVSAALVNLENSTVPLWHWIFEPSFRLREELPFYTLWGGEKRRRNTFKLLEKLSISPKDFESSFEKTEFPEFWFSKDVSDDLVIAALEYLGAVGDDGLDIDWPKYIGSSEANIARAAVRARARIKARTNTTEALRFIAQYESTDLGAELTAELLANISTIETEVLRGCLKNRTTSFTGAIAAELSSRSALSKSDTQLVCESTEAEIRLIGVKALANQSHGLMLSDARRVLIKPRKTNAFVLFTSPQDRDYPGEAAFKKYKIGVLSELSYVELLELQKDESFFSTEATLAIYLSQFKRVKAQLEQDLLDAFDSFCTERRNAVLGTPGEPSEAVFSYVKNNLLQAALEVYCCKAVKSDLALVRKVVDKYEIKFATVIAEFFMIHGEWEDAVRLAKLSGNLKYGFGLSLLSMVDHTSDHRLAARTILKLSAKRIADAWKLDLSASVRVQLVVQMPKKLFTAFDDRSIIEMLLMGSDVVREVVALKAVLCLPKGRLRAILSSYYEVDGSYYYNPIYWLDLGVSADRETSKAVARRELESS